MMLHVLPFMLALAGLAASQQAPPAQVPAVPAQAVQRPPTQAPPPFDEKADAKAAIESAVQAAATDDIRVLIAWGANDDNGSKLFVAAKRAPEIASPRFFSDEYKSVNVDVGHLDKNLDLAKSYGVTLKADALPALTVIDAAGKVIANTNAATLRPGADPAGIDPVKVAAFLKSHQAPAPDAVAPFEAALKQAKREGKTVFVWFSAPW
jgi:thioredoxin 1